MATGRSQTYLLPYPQVDDNVNVHGDVASLVSTLDTTLQGLGLSYMKLDVKNVSGSTIPAATPVYVTGYNGKTTIAVSLSSTTQPVLGLTKTSIANNAEGICVVSGVLPQVNTSSFVAGDVLYVGTTGGLTKTRPSTGSVAIGVCAYADASNGIIVIEARGNGTWGALKNGLS
jgi:hypothetical protein